MLEGQADLDYQIADDVRYVVASKPRSLAFPEGLSSHTKVAVPDAIEDEHLRIADVDSPPGVKVADLRDCPGQKVADVQPAKGLKVAKPAMLSATGDFRLPIKISGENSQSRQAAGLKMRSLSPGPRLRRR